MVRMPSKVSMAAISSLFLLLMTSILRGWILLLACGSGPGSALLLIPCHMLVRSVYRRIWWLNGKCIAAFFGWWVLTSHRGLMCLCGADTLGITGIWSRKLMITLPPLPNRCPSLLLPLRYGSGKPPRRSSVSRGWPFTTVF